MAGETLFDCFQKGFSIKKEVQYLRCIKSVLKEVPKLGKHMDMGGFGLKLGSDVTINLTYDDVDELKEHEKLSEFVGMKLDNIFEMIGADKSELADFQTELPDEADGMPEQLQMMRLGLKLANDFSALLKASEGKNSLTLNLLIEGSGHFQVKLTADGWGPAANLGFNMASKGQRESLTEMLGMM